MGHLMKMFGRSPTLELLKSELISKMTVLDWVIHKVKEIQHCAGLSHDGFEDQFLALLPLRTGQTHPNYEARTIQLRKETEN